MLDLLHHLAIRIDHNTLLHPFHRSAGLPRTWRLEYLIKLFQTDTFRLNEEEVDHHELEQVPEDEEYIEPEADLSGHVSH
jgi:hypothetical protein